MTIPNISVRNKLWCFAKASFLINLLRNTITKASALKLSQRIIPH